jgi:polysaccharide transporter, PST family
MIGDIRVEPDTRAMLRRIGQLSAAFVCSNAVRGGIALALAMVLGRGLGAERFGVWILCTATASTLTAIVDLGFGVLLTRDGAQPHTNPSELLTASLTLRLAAAVPLAFALWAAAPFASAGPETAGALRIAAIVGVAGSAYGCFGALLRSQPVWLPTVLAIETGWFAVQVVASRAAIAAGAAVSGLLVLAAALQIAQIATAVALWRPVFGDRSPSPFMAAPECRRLLRRALPFALSGLMANLQARIGPLMLGTLATSTEVGLFGAASRVGRAIKLGPQAVFAGALPVLAQEYGRDRNSGRRTSATLERMVGALALAAAVVCAIAAPLIMRIVFGPAFTGGTTALVFIALGLAPALTNSTRKIALYAAGREHVAVKLSAAALAAQIAAGAALIPRFGSGGAAIAIAIGEAAIWSALRREVGRTASQSHVERAAAGVEFPQPAPQSFTSL